MPIPDYQTLMRPVLALLEDGQIQRTRAIKDAMVAQLGLSQEEIAQMLPSGRTRLIDSRVSWALTYLAQAGLIHKPSRGHAVINERGRQALRDNPTRIDNEALEQYPEFQQFKTRERATTNETSGTLAPEGEDAERETVEAATPTDLLGHAVARNRAAVEGEVLKAAMELSPTGFEDLVIQVLAAMGYGSAGSVERTSATGDAGIDGIISQDPLGLDRIYVQAKRYAQDHPIQRPRIHEFAGALLGKQGDRGVFITTSRFTDGARAEADRINARIELIDGARLAQLLVEYEVGVQPQQTVTLYRLDEDFFDTL